MSQFGCNISVLCVDDNPQVVDAIRIKLSRLEGFEWKGSLTSADGLFEAVKRDCPTLVILDLDMPGVDPLDVVAKLAESCPETRIVVFSGHIHQDLVKRALDAGVWGYALKNDGEDELVKVLTEVASGNVSVSPTVRTVYDPP